ncbi:RICIN domain-containing protein [Streptomyces sp. NPDC001480]|uniref:RICIN domain-containing protein n=1 Tax=Streptomyces sp. NPDC001480 TaxID=3364577 RepID=UPI0036B34685
MSAVNQNGGNCLDLADSSTADGVQLIQWPCHGGGNQTFTFTFIFTFTFTTVRGTTDQYGLGTSTRGKCIEVNGASSADNATIVQRACGNGANQKFRAVPVTINGTNNVFALQAVHSGKCVARSGDSSAGNTGLVQLPCNNATSRVWRLPDLAGGGGTTTPPTNLGMPLLSDTDGAVRAPGCGGCWRPCRRGSRRPSGCTG